MSTDIKLSKSQLSKIVQSGGSFGAWLSDLGKQVLTNIVIPLARKNLPAFVNKLTSSAIKNLNEK